MSRPRKPHGGRREGAGRPLAGSAPLECLVSVRVTKKQYATFQRLGGTEWLRTMLDWAESAEKKWQ